MSYQADFFQTDGTMPPDRASYVTRDADRELFRHVCAGAFCYILAARQMGKSSLMEQTIRRLRERGIVSARIDLTAIGSNVSVDQWYRGLLTKIQEELKLAVDVTQWLGQQPELTHPQIFQKFVHDVVLTEQQGPVVIFIDEIDVMLNFDFRDDFFAVIRATYNARASDAVYQRLTFVLLGVATPNDLIQNRKITPFNIGQRIILRGFHYEQSQPFRQGLDQRYPGQGDRLLRLILDWTNGQPCLSQKLCLAAVQAEAPPQRWDRASVDRLVENAFFSKAGRGDQSFEQIRLGVEGRPRSERRKMLELYRKIQRRDPVPDDDRSPTQNYLELVGLARVEQGKLQVWNEIYRRVFDQAWIKEAMPSESLWPFVRSSTAVGAVLALVTTGLLVWQGYLSGPFLSATATAISTGPTTPAPQGATALPVTTGAASTATPVAISTVTPLPMIPTSGEPTTTRVTTATPSSGGVSNQIAFTSNRDGTLEIYVMGAGGSDPRNLTMSKANNAHPAWSPDGRQIAFETDREGNDEIYVMNADGTDQHNLTHSLGTDIQPAWSPDGGQIAFVSGRDGDLEIYVMDAEGKEQRRLTTSPGDDLNPAWSPDGRQIAFVSERDGNREIYLMDSKDGTILKQLTKSSQGTNNQQPAWSPDGRQIAFTSTRDGNSEIYIMDADGANQRRLTQSTANERFAAWSPDGRLIAFDSDSEASRGFQNDIFTMQVDGTDRRDLTSNRGDDRYPAWSRVSP